MTNKILYLDKFGSDWFHFRNLIGAEQISNVFVVQVSVSCVQRLGLFHPHSSADWITGVLNENKPITADYFRLTSK